MDKRYLYLFQREVERQCRFAIMAYQEITHSLQTRDLDILWYSVQAFLMAVGNVSKLMWPSRPNIPERGPELRASLSVDENSPLRPRTFRNHFEHFDERLEMWMVSSERHNLLDSSVGPPDMVKGFDPRDYLRNFDTTNFAVIFRGDTYLLNPIIEAVRDLWEKAKIEARKPPW